MRIRIGDAIQMFGLTSRAVRFYEERGLLTSIRSAHNVRYFDREGRQRLEWIAKLRRCGISLPEIGEVLLIEDSTGRRRAALEKLRARREALSGDLEQLDRVIAGLVDESAEPNAPLQVVRDVRAAARA